MYFAQEYSEGSSIVINLENFKEDVERAITQLFEDAEANVGAPVIKHDALEYKGETKDLYNADEISLRDRYADLRNELETHELPQDCMDRVNDLWKKTDLGKKIQVFEELEAQGSRELWENIITAFKNKLLRVISVPTNDHEIGIPTKWCNQTTQTYQLTGDGGIP